MTNLNFRNIKSINHLQKKILKKDKPFCHTTELIVLNKCHSLSHNLFTCPFTFNNKLIKTLSIKASVCSVKKNNKKNNLLCTNKNQQINKTENLNLYTKVLPFWYHYTVVPLLINNLLLWDAITK